MEKKKKIKITEKLVNNLKHIGFYLKLIFWVIAICLTGGVASFFIPCNRQDYKSDEDQMREWMEREKTRKMIYEIED